MQQIDGVTAILIREIISLSSSEYLPAISPASSIAHRKVEILFQSLERLVELLHLKGRIGPILDDEIFAFLHCFLFQKAAIILLPSHEFP